MFAQPTADPPTTSSPRYLTRPVDPDAARELGRACDLGPTVAQVLLHRGIDDAAQAAAFLDPRLHGMSDPAPMADRELAADRLARGIRARERIAVFGDYDVDGTTSAAILADVIEALGGDVSALVANRFEGGYGFSDAGLDRCLAVGASLIVTCDCGSSDHERIARARRSGVDVVVVDHHLVPAEPLPSLAFLNPHRPDCGFAYKGMASAGLAFSLGAALRAAVGSRLDIRPWLDLVALGTVADVAPLDGDNRRLVRAGLGSLMEARRPGVKALRDVARVKTPVGATDIAFRLAPRLNAAGRLGDPTITLSLLRARELSEATSLAERIEAINDERKNTERRCTQEAIDQVLDVYGSLPKHGVVVGAPGWHRGVVGITAARLVDRFGQPALVVGIDGSLGHGSGRSIEGVSVYDALMRCSGCFERFGGHAAAVGFTIKPEKLDRLRAEFADSTQPMSSGSARVPEVDCVIDGNTFPLPRVRDVWRLEPLGEKNREPLFALEDAQLLAVSAVGQDDAHLKLRVRVGSQTVEAFGYDLGYLAAELPDRADLMGHVRFDHFRGGRSVEFRVTDLSASGSVVHGRTQIAEPKDV